jgi:inosine-uridine nucleoside N-ribohydrolase
MKIRILLLAGCLFLTQFTGRPAHAAEVTPVKIIFDTDIGNDVDDVMALAVLHAFETRGDCKLLGVTITKPDELAGPFVDAIDTFYGRPNIPIGFNHSTLTNPPSPFLSLAQARDGGKVRYPHRLKRSSDAQAATRLLRKLLNNESDQTVVIIQVGYFSNLAALLDTKADEISLLSGRELARRKVKLLSVMAGSFKQIGQNKRFGEFNVVQDLPAARKVAAEWPTPVVWSGFEIGIAIPYPSVSVTHDFSYVAHHPVAEAYCLYKPMPYDRPTWDLTAALYAVLPDRGYFGLSEPGRVTVESDGFTSFAPSQAGDGRDRFLTLTDVQAARVKEALVQLATQPPDCGKLDR